MSARRRRSAIGLPFWWLRGGVIPDGSDLSTIAERQLAQGVYAISESDPANLTVTLKQGATTISTQSFAAIASTPTTSSWNLSAGERALITDWSALRVELAKDGGQVDVLDLSLSAPAAEVPTALTGSAAKALGAAPTNALVLGISVTGTAAGAVGGVPTGTLPVVVGLTGSAAKALGASAPQALTTGVGLVGAAAPALGAVPTTALAVQVALTGSAAGALGAAPTNPLGVGAALTVTLLEGATTRATWNIAPGASATTSALTLSTPERGAIGNWGNLRVTLTKAGGQIDVYDISLETPAPGGNASLTGTSPKAVGAVAGGTFFVGISASLTGSASRVLGAVPTGTFTATGPTLQVELLEGATVRATWVVAAGASVTTETLTLSAGEVATIGNWANLRARLTQSVGQVVVYDLQLEAPDAPNRVVEGSPARGLAASATNALQVQVTLSGASARAVVGVPSGTFLSPSVLVGAAAKALGAAATSTLTTVVWISGTAAGALGGVPTGTFAYTQRVVGSAAGAVAGVPTSSFTVVLAGFTGASARVLGVIPSGTFNASSVVTGSAPGALGKVAVGTVYAPTAGVPDDGASVYPPVGGRDGLSTHLAENGTLRTGTARIHSPSTRRQTLSTDLDL